MADTARALERITLNLTPRSVEALAEAVARTGDTKTDTVNRAIQVYNYMEQLMSSGGAVYVRAAEGGELERLQVF